MTTDSIFRIYSMTKPLVSVAAMMLVEDGTIQLTDPVSKYLPGFDKLQVSVPQKNDAGQTTYTLVPQERQMTVQDLLRHTSGLAYGEITQNAPVKDGYEKIGVYSKAPRFRRAQPRAGRPDREDGHRAARLPTRHDVALQPRPRTCSAAWSSGFGQAAGRLPAGAPVRAAQDGATRAFWVPAAKISRVAESLEKDRFAGRPSR